VEQVLHPLYALDRVDFPNELLDLPVALEPTAQEDDAVVGVDADLACGDASLAKGDALDLLSERDVVGWLLVTADARYGVRSLVGDALGDALEIADPPPPEPPRPVRVPASQVLEAVADLQIPWYR
jgi:hypothetical protein